jgi:CheY-like chemotaxis protein
MDAAVASGNGTDTKRLLVVEDQRIICRDICKTLEELGYVVCATARTSDEALEQAAAHQPDLVLMDIRIIGQVDGVEVATELKRRHHVPVVFLTGNTDEETLQRAFRAGPDGYLEHLPEPVEKLRGVARRDLYWGWKPSSRTFPTRCGST